MIDTATNTMKVRPAISRATARVLGWLDSRPLVRHGAGGFMWIVMVLIAIGKGQEWAVFCAFLGMFWWALLTKDYEDVLHDLRRALDGWQGTIDDLSNALAAPSAEYRLSKSEEAVSRSAECAHPNLPVKYDPQACEGKDAGYVRKHYPRFDGDCPDCGERVIGYASAEHYYAGDW